MQQEKRRHFTKVGCSCCPGFMYGAFKHGELFLLPFCEKNLTSSVLMKKFHSGVNIIKHIYGELVYAFLEQK